MSSMDYVALASTTVSLLDKPQPQWRCCQSVRLRTLDAVLIKFPGEQKVYGERVKSDQEMVPCVVFQNDDSVHGTLCTLGVEYQNLKKRSEKELKVHDYGQVKNLNNPFRYDLISRPNYHGLRSRIPEE